MRELLIIIAIVGVIVFASGCTGDQTATDNTYSGNGVSFTYPGNWTVLDPSDIQSSVGSLGDVLVVVGVENEQMFGLMTANVGSNQVLATPSEWLSTMKSSVGSEYVSSKTITVDGVKGVQLVTQDSSTSYYNYYAYWNKNSKGYMALLTSTTSAQDTFESIIDTVETS